MDVYTLATSVDNGQLPDCSLAEALKLFVDYKREIETLMEQKEAELKSIKASLAQIDEYYIPNLLSREGVTSAKLDDGTTVTAKQDVFASIPKIDVKARKEAIDWLNEHGAGNLIKRSLVIDSVDEKTRASLYASGISFTEQTEVNPQSLRAYFRAELGFKKGIPSSMSEEEVPSCFGLYIKNTTKLS